MKRAPPDIDGKPAEAEGIRKLPNGNWEKITCIGWVYGIIWNDGFEWLYNAFGDLTSHGTGKYSRPDVVSTETEAKCKLLTHLARAREKGWKEHKGIIRRYYHSKITKARPPEGGKHASRNP